MSQKRFRTEWRQLSRRERVQQYLFYVKQGFLDLWDAIRTPPPTRTSVYVEVSPCDPDYDKAEWSLHVDPHPARFRFSDGKWHQV